MLERFQRQYLTEKLFSADQKIILTISGGIDSMAMLKLFALSNLRFAIAHANFHLRGEESEEDARFVSQVAKNFHVPFYYKEFDTKSFAAEHKLSVQEAARYLRYEWFEELISEFGYDLYATAHHFDDQIETFFINLLRGTGVAGLRGIQARNGNCIRPLLFASRPEIEKFARDHLLKYREDSSNRSDAYLRNRIRQSILPALDNADSGFRTGFAQTFENLGMTESFIHSQMKKIRSGLMHKTGDDIIIPRKELKGFESAELIMWELLKEFDFNRTTVHFILNALEGIPGKTFYSDTHVLLVDREALLIRPLDENELHIEAVRIDEEQTSVSAPVAMKFEKEPVDANFTIDSGSNTAQLDFDKLRFPLTIRRPVRGDYFYPLGLGGKKLLSDFFTDKKLSALEKENTWLLVSGGCIVWVIGQRIDDRFKVSQQTKSVFRIHAAE